jgi:WD40 repeat protein
MPLSFTNDRFIPHREAKGDEPEHNQMAHNQESTLALLYAEALLTPLTPRSVFSLAREEVYKSVSRRNKSHFNLRSGEILDVPNVPNQPLSNLLSWSSEDRVFTVSSNHGTQYQIISALAYENTNQDRALILFEKQNQPIYALASFGQEMLISGQENGRVGLHHLSYSRPFKMVDTPSLSDIGSILVTSAQTFIVGDKNAVLKTADIRTKGLFIDEIRTSYASNQITTFAYNDSEFVAVGLQNGEVKIFDTRQLKRDEAFSSGFAHTGPIKGLHFKPHSRVNLFSADASVKGELVLENILTGETKQKIQTGHPVTGLHFFSGDSKMIVTTHQHQKSPIKLWQEKSNQLISQKPCHHSSLSSGPVMYLAGSSSSNDFSIISDNETLTFFSLKHNDSFKSPNIRPNQLSSYLALR